MRKVVIVGGGPSGILTGILAKNSNNEVIVLERNEKPLKKLLLTGSGKCNYFNDYYDNSCYISEDMDQVDRILTLYNIQQVKEYFDSIGLIPKIKNGYYYPYTFQASTMEKMLLEEARHKDIIIKHNSFVSKVIKEDDLFYVTCGDEVITCDDLVLACGSKAVPKTGSTGKGYELLKKFDHTIIPPVPALVQLVGEGRYFKDWDGVRAEVKVSLFENGEFVDSEEGEIQLTSYGVSGICVFNLSHKVSRGLEEERNEEIHINFVPFVDIPIPSFLDEASKRNSYKTVGELLEGFLNPKLIKVLLERCFIHEYDFYKDLSNDDKNALAKALGDFVVPIKETKGFEFCQICSGGLKLSEIHPDTMESRLVPNLYVVGELLDMNGKCGGYNLTVCWISAMLAGKSIGDKK